MYLELGEVKQPPFQQMHFTGVSLALQIHSKQSVFFVNEENSIEESYMLNSFTINTETMKPFILCDLILYHCSFLLIFCQFMIREVSQKYKSAE